jgi:hypothetical protein
MKRSFERVLSTIGAATVLVVGLNAISYAATGSTFLLGGTNTAKKVTTIRNTGPGAVMNLQAKSSAYAPFTTNGKGLVGNLNSQFLSGKSLAQVQAGSTQLNGLTAAQIQDGATKLNGLTAAQIQDGATKLNGLSASDIVAAGNAPLLSFTRTNAATVSYPVTNGQTFPAVASDTASIRGSYQLTGTVNYACAPNPVDSYVIYLFTWDGTTEPQIVGQRTGVSNTECGKDVGMPSATVGVTDGMKLMVMVYGSTFIGPSYFPATLSFSVTSGPARNAL